MRLDERITTPDMVLVGAFDAGRPAAVQDASVRRDTRSARALPMQGGTTYTFVTDGIEAALELARAVAESKNVGVWGSANLISSVDVSISIALIASLDWVSCV